MIRQVRHGYLKKYDRIWIAAGRLFRWTSSHLGIFRTVSHRIGEHGPFKMDGCFAFSDFANWGHGHNNGFASCIEASKGASCVFDVGAHIGLVTLPMSSVLGEDGVVISFEPAEANLKHLKSHVRKNNIQNVVVIDKLVGREKKDNVLFYESDDATGMNSIVQKNKTKDYSKKNKQQISIDEYCKESGYLPVLIKIDVEGAEIDVLEGAVKTITMAKPDIYLSVHPREIILNNQTIDDLVKLIHRIGYDCYEVDGSDVQHFRLAEYFLTPKKDN